MSRAYWVPGSVFAFRSVMVAWCVYIRHTNIYMTLCAGIVGISKCDYSHSHICASWWGALCIFLANMMLGLGCWDLLVLHSLQFWLPNMTHLPKAHRSTTHTYECVLIRNHGGAIKLALCQPHITIKHKSSGHHFTSALSYIPSKALQHQVVGKETMHWSFDSPRFQLPWQLLL